jgi:hypothetical protein
MTRQAKGPELPPLDEKLRVLKRRTPEQSKRYQAESRLSTGEEQKNKRFERKYDMSILGNIYIFATCATEDAQLGRFPEVNPLYKAIYWDVSGICPSRSSIEVRSFWGVVTVLSATLVWANAHEMTLHLLNRWTNMPAACRLPAPGVCRIRSASFAGMQSQPNS